LAHGVAFDCKALIVPSPPGVRLSEGRMLSQRLGISSGLRAVPTARIETRLLAGDIGEFIVIARRYRGSWFVGAMTNEAARTVKVPLDFLGTGRFIARIHADGDTHRRS
jgi:hypothetical protein